MRYRCKIENYQAEWDKMVEHFRAKHPKLVASIGMNTEAITAAWQH